MSFPLPSSAGPMPLNVNDKLSIVLFFVIVALATPPTFALVAVVVMLLARKAVPAFRPIPGGPGRFATVFSSLTVLAALMTLINGVLLAEGSSFDILGITVYEGGLLFGLATGARLLLITTVLLVFFGSVSISRLAAYLHGAGLPTPLTMTILLTVHFLESIPDRIGRIFAAQEARGAPVRSRIDLRLRSFLSVLGPLMLSGLVESIERGTALELRGYHSASTLTFDEQEPVRLTPVSGLFLFLSITVLLLAWALR